MTFVCFRLSRFVPRRIRQSAVVLLAALLCAGVAHAQVKIAPPPDTWVRPQLVIAAHPETPVVLQSVRVRAEVSGRLALTEIEMTFFNPNRRVLEGELQFPLLDGQSVDSFALDINGVLREAVPVEKARGQAVFEDVIRARVDPALLERTVGNNFKLRVYPLPANGTRRVVVRVSEALAAVAGRMGPERLRYRLPLDYADKLASFALDIRVAGAGSAPVLAPGALGSLAFAQHDGDFRAEVTRRDFSARGILDLEIPSAGGPRAATQIYEGKTYFYADVPLPVREAPRSIPQLVGIVWDSSGSAAARDHAREFALLDAYFKRMRNGEVRLTRVRDAVEPAQSFRVVDGDWRALRDALAATPYDGATNLAAFAPEPQVREYLLFSDGLVNFGEQPFPETKVPLYAICAATRSDAGLLRHLAHRSGGRFIDLAAETPAAAAHTLLTATSHVTRVDATGAAQLVLGSPYPAGTGRGGTVAVAGQLTDADAAVRADIVHPDGTHQSITVPVHATRSAGALAAGQWARLRLAELDAEYDINRAEIRRLGQAFRLVTRETSLIVLDRVQDYARYDIAPPAELRGEYDRLVQAAAQRRDADRKSHMEKIVRAFAEKTAWWERDYPKGDRPQAKDKEEKMSVNAPRAAGAVANANGERDAAAPRLAAPGAPPVAAPAMSHPRAEDAMRPAEASLREAEPARKVADGAPVSQSAASATIQLQKWRPDAPYAARLRDAPAATVYRVYLDERAGYLDSTAFYLDAADVLFEKGLTDLGVRVLSNLAEMNLENRHILRILGYRLVQAGQARLAIPVFKKVLALSPEEPQSYRDLGLAYAADGQSQKAVDTLYEVVVRPWHDRFPEIELITLAELNAIAVTADTAKVDTSRMDPRLTRNLPLDLRAVLTWDADNTDIDLWVTDPNGEKAFYGNRFTYQGGRNSLDFTGGYGPEEFSLRHAKPGKYKVEAQYFGDRRQNVAGPTTLQVRLTTRFGMPGQKEQIVTLRLKDRSEVVFVGEFEVK